jgi:hypothetical protein
MKRGAAKPPSYLGLRVAALRIAGRGGAVPKLKRILCSSKELGGLQEEGGRVGRRRPTSLRPRPRHVRPPTRMPLETDRPRGSPHGRLHATGRRDVAAIQVRHR